MKHKIQIAICTATISLLFSYENKFSYVNTAAGSGKVSLEHTPKFIDRIDGYTRLARIGEGHAVMEGMPELPKFTTFYQLDPSKTYDFLFEVLDSYTIEDINILPHQGIEKWEVESVNVINEEVYNSYSVYPEQNMLVADRMQGRGIEFVSIQVIPYKYYPKYKKLEVYTSIDIQVVEKGENPDHTLFQPKRSHIFDEFYKDLIVNF